MPGFFNTMGTYLAGAGKSALFAYNKSPTLQRTVLGALAGGITASVAGNSVLGGAILGAGIGRYGGAGIMSARNSGRGILSPGRSAMAYGEAFGKGMSNMARRDMMRMRVMSNNGYNRIRGLFR